MINLNNYINEKLVINKDTFKKVHTYNFAPKTKAELYNIIDELIKERGKDADLNDVDVSAITNFAFTFEEFPIRNINISQWDVSHGTVFTSMFSGCENFNADLSNWDMSNAETIRKMFNGCRAFSGEGLENWNMPKLTSSARVFEDCENFDCDVSNWDMSQCLDINQMFLGCTNFKGIGLEKWNIKDSANTYQTFDNCSKLKNMPGWYHE